MPFDEGVMGKYPPIPLIAEHCSGNPAGATCFVVAARWIIGTVPGDEEERIAGRCGNYVYSAIVS